jgi:hypothetical protein
MNADERRLGVAHLFLEGEVGVYARRVRVRRDTRHGAVSQSGPLSLWERVRVRVRGRDSGDGARPQRSTGFQPVP